MTAGHRLVPHTADVRIEAWGPSRAAAFGEAVTALASSYASWPPEVHVTEVPVVLTADSDEELLVALLDEAVFLPDARGLVPIRAAVTADGAVLGCVFAAAVQIVGPVPKGISWSDLVCGPDDGGWRCAVTVDV